MAHPTKRNSSRKIVSREILVFMSVASFACIDGPLGKLVPRQRAEVANGLENLIQYSKLIGKWR